MEEGISYPGITLAFFCHDGNGNFLMQKRGKNCRDEQGKWDIGSGSLNFGDTVDGTLRREIREEYSTDVLEYKFVGYRDIHREYEGMSTHWVALDHIVLVDREMVANGEPHKFDEIGWFGGGNMPQPLHSQVFRFLRKYQQEIFRAKG